MERRKDSQDVQVLRQDFYGTAFFAMGNDIVAVSIESSYRPAQRVYDEPRFIRITFFLREISSWISKWYPRDFLANQRGYGSVINGMQMNSYV